MKARHKARESFVADLVKACPKAGVWHATRLMRFGSAVEGLMHNGHFNYTKYQRLSAKVREIAHSIDCGVMFVAHSPCIRLLTPDGKHLGIPTS